MGMETELKFRLPARSLTTLAKGRVPGVAGGRSERARLVSTYFDTAKHKLRRYGLSLRVHEAHRKKLQTVKSVTRGPIGRGEWETEIDALSPDLEQVSDSPLQRFSTKKLGRKLKPIFRTLVRRTTVPLRSGKAEIELAVDQGTLVLTFLV